MKIIRWIAVASLLILLCSSYGYSLAIPDQYESADDAVSESTIITIATKKAEQVWGVVSFGELIPMVGADGKVAAYYVCFALGDEVFPSYEEILENIQYGRELYADAVKLLGGYGLPPVPDFPDQDDDYATRADSIYTLYREGLDLTWGIRGFVTVLVSARFSMYPIMEYFEGLPRFYTMGDIVENKVLQNWGRIGTLGKIHFSGPLDQVYEFIDGEEKILIDPYPVNVISEAEKSSKIHSAIFPTDTSIIQQNSAKWEDFATKDFNPLVQHIVDNQEFMPIYLWTRLCLYTATSMVMGYWDNKNAAAGYYAGYGNIIDWYKRQETEPGSGVFNNVPNVLDELGDTFEPAGWNWASDWVDALEDVINDGDGYSFDFDYDRDCFIPFTDCWDWCWGEITEQIDDEYPFIWSVYYQPPGADKVGHSLAAWGYEDNDKDVGVYNTWDAAQHWWHYDLYNNGNDVTDTYVHSVRPGGSSSPNDLRLLTPNGGEEFTAIRSNTVTWYQKGAEITKVTISVSVDHGNTWSNVAQNISSSGEGIHNYEWSPQNDQNGTATRLRVQGFNSSNEQIASEGSFGDFTIKELDPIEAGLEWLASHQVPYGSDKGYWRFNGTGYVGSTALAVIALHKGGYTYSDPVMQKAITYITSKNHGTNGGFYIGGNQATYSTAMALMAMQAVKNDPGSPSNLDTYITWGRNYLINGRNGDGGWRYYANYGQSDLSVTQWPALALYEGGYSNQSLWDGVSSFATARQQIWGEFRYSASYSQGGGSMTGAGLWCLLFNSNIGFTDSRVLNGFKWLTDNWTVNNIPGYCHGGAYGYYYYYLFSLAKACQLSGQDIINDHNWFAEISEKLLSLQSDDGSWPRYNGSEYTEFPTIMALLVLQLNEIPPSKAKYKLNSYADLHLVGPNGGHTGLDYSYDPPVMEMGIPNSLFEYEGPDSTQIITIDPIDDPGAFGYYLKGTGNGTWDLEIELYQDTQLVQTFATSGNIEEDQILGCNVIIDAPGGSVIMIPCEPDILPCPETDPTAVTYAGLPGDTIINELQILEVCGSQAIETINIIPHDLTNDSTGQIIPASSFRVTPASFPSIPAGESVMVTCTLIVPEALEYGSYSGTLGIQTINALNRGIRFDVHLGMGDIMIAVTNDGKGLYGVPVDLYNSSDSLVGTTCTDISGCCGFAQMRYDNYIACIVPPLGYIPEFTAMEIYPSPDGSDTASFAVTEMNIIPSQQNSSFWKHIVAISIWGADDESEIGSMEPLPVYADLIYKHFQHSPVHPIALFQEPLSGDGYRRILALGELLTATLPSKDSSIIDPDVENSGALKPTSFGGDYRWDSEIQCMAVRELTALLLNIASERLATFNPISEDEMTAGQLVTYASELVLNGKGDDDLDAYHMLRRVNYGQPLLAGTIPSTTADVAYMSDLPDIAPLPDQFSLEQNIPNPFNPVTDIKFGIPQGCEVKLTVFNILGQQVAVLADGYMEAGYYTIPWDSRSDGRQLASGVYLYRLEAGTFVETKRMMLLK